MQKKNSLIHQCVDFEVDLLEKKGVMTIEKEFNLKWCVCE